MVDFNQKDFNLTKVAKESKLATLVTRSNYRVYGLRQENNPPILIEYNNEDVDDTFIKYLNVLQNFFKANGIEVETYDGLDKELVSIGLRRDLREIVTRNEEPRLASSILSTIVYCLEGRIDLNELSKYRLANVPKLTKRQ